MDNLFLSTPSARRATSCCGRLSDGKTYFYPRPPRGGRLGFHVTDRDVWEFLSTPSARRATCGVSELVRRVRNFYPRPPRGGRRCGMGLLSLVFGFLSTPSARRATYLPPSSLMHCAISIHALREEGDSPYRPRRALRTNFYPRPPRGGRPASAPVLPATWGISIHALREEGDLRMMALI